MADRRVDVAIQPAPRVSPPALGACRRLGGVPILGPGLQGVLSVELRLCLLFLLCPGWADSLRHERPGSTHGAPCCCEAHLREPPDGERPTHAREAVVEAPGLCLVWCDE